MEKKKYIKPQFTAYPLKPCRLLDGSPFGPDDMPDPDLGFNSSGDDGFNKRA